MNDINLIEKAKSGDKNAFSEIYRQTHKKLYRYCRNLCGNDFDADDLMQQVYLTAWTKINQFCGENISSWLRTVARNTFLDNLKKKSPEYSADEEYCEIPEDKALIPENITERKELCEIIFKVLNGYLPPLHRTTVLLYYYDEKSVSEISRIMQCSEGTVKSRLYYSRKKLHEEFSKIKNILLYGVAFGFVLIRNKLKDFKISGLSVNSRITISVVLTAAAMAATSVNNIEIIESRTPHEIIRIESTSDMKNTATASEKQLTTENISRVSYNTTTNKPHETSPESEYIIDITDEQAEEFQEKTATQEEGDTEEITAAENTDEIIEEETTMKKELITIATAATMAVSGMTTTTAYSENLTTAVAIAENTEISETKTYDIWFDIDEMTDFAAEKAQSMAEEYADTLDRTKYTDSEIYLMQSEYYHRVYLEMVEQTIPEMAEGYIAELGIDMENAEISRYVPIVVCNITEEQAELAKSLGGIWGVWEHETGKIGYTLATDETGEIKDYNFINYDFVNSSTSVKTGEISEILTQGMSFGHLAGDPAIEFSIQDEEIAKIVKTDGTSIYVEGISSGSTFLRAKVTDDDGISHFYTHSIYVSENGLHYANTKGILSGEVGEGIFTRLSVYDFGNKSYEIGDSPVQYTVDDENIAKISNFQGDIVNLRGISAGETVLRAETPEGETAEVRVVVSEYVMTTTVAIWTTPAEAVTTTIDLCGGDIYASYISGDANSDFKVSISDAVKILQNIANSEKYTLTEQETINADCYDPGSGITGLDAAAIQKFDAKIIDKLPETFS